MNLTGTRQRLTILTNLIAPYRVPLYANLARQFRVHLVLSGIESNRQTWKGIPDGLGDAKVRRLSGIMIRMRSGRSTKASDLRYMHVNPAYMSEMQRLSPDAIISAEMGLRTLCALLYSTLRRRRLWVWSAGTVHTDRRSGLARGCLRWLLVRWVRRWMSYGQAATEYLCSIGVPRNRILQIQNCVDESLFRRAVEPALRISPQPVLLHVGQLIERKGLRYLFESVGRLQREGLVFSLVLVGDGPEREALEGLVRSLALQNVTILPPRPPADMPSIYRSADCLVFPTLEDVWGLVVNEALWSGLPVIASVHAGCTREIVPAQNRFDPTDASDFDRAMRCAIRGELAPVDTSPLKTSAEVAQLIIEDIERVLSKRRRPNGGAAGMTARATLEVGGQ